MSKRIARGAIAYAQTLSGADYLEAIGKVHAYGREPTPSSSAMTSC